MESSASEWDVRMAARELSGEGARARGGAVSEKDLTKVKGG